MRRYILITYLLLTVCNATASDIVNYLQQYKQNKISDYSLEAKILAGYDLEKLTGELSPFLSDSLVDVRQKSFYLVYKKGLQNDRKDIAVKTLLKGIDDSDGGINGQTLTYLQEFSSGDFDREDRTFINTKLPYYRMPHYRELVLLAGYIGTGTEILYRQYLNNDLPERTRWNVALALARNGRQEQIQHCLKTIKAISVDNRLVGNILPDLIYIRQKETIDYCIELLNSDEKLCYSLNPDVPEKMICAYQIIELLAPVIINIPVKLDASGDIDTNDYQKTLKEVREWFKEHPDYGINRTRF